MTRVWIERLRAGVLSALLVGTVLTVVVGAPTTTSAQTTDTTTDTTTTDTTDPASDREFAGADRYETSANLASSYAAKSSSSNSVILAGGGLIDAAAAAGLARAVNAPVLLTPTDRLSPQARQFIIDERITTIYIVGGTAAVSAAVATELAALSPPPTVERLAGPDRYATSAALSRAIAQPAGTQPADYCGTGMPTAVLANVDKTFADVIALGPLAYSQRVPVLLTSVGSLSQAVSDYLAEANIEQVVVVGGEAAVSPAVVAQLEAAGTQVQRVAGPTRYATALSIREAMGACEGLTLSPSTYALINGEASADGIAAGPLLGLGLARDGVTPVLLVEKDRLPPETQEHLDAVNAAQQSNPSHPPVVLTVIGGVAVVAPVVAQAAAETAAATQATVTTTTQPPDDDDDDDDDDDNGGSGGGGGGGSGPSGGGGNGGSGGGPSTPPPNTVPPSISLSGLPATAPTPFTFGGTDRIQTFDFTVSPANANVTFTAVAGAANSGLTTAVTATPGGNAGEYTLTVIAPAIDDGSGPYSDTVTVTATDTTGVRTAGTRTIAVTLTPALITLSGLPATPTAFTFGDSEQTLPFTVAPANATLTFEAVSTNSLVTAAVTGTGADRTLTITPVATDPGTSTYTDTVTLTATDTTDGRADATQTVEVVFNRTSSNVSIAGVVGGAAAFAFAETARTVTFDIAPADAAFTVESANGAATANNALTVAKVLDSGTDRSFTITAPASDDGAGPYTDTVTITATSGAETATQALIYTLTPTTPTLTGLPTAAPTPFTFGGTNQVQTFDFTIVPANAAYTFSATTPGLATASVAATTGGNAGEYTLTVSAHAIDTAAGLYTDTVTVTASDSATGRASATETMTITLTPTAATLTGLPAAAPTPFTFGGPGIANPVQTQTFDFTVAPANATYTFTAVAGAAAIGVTATVAATTGGDAGEYTLTVAAPATDDGSGPYTDTVTVTATDSVATSRAAGTATMTLTLTPAPLALSGLPATAPTTFTFGGTDQTQTFPFTVTPANATVAFTATAAGEATNGVTALVAATTGGNPGEYTLTVTAPATDSGDPYTDTITVTATDSDDGRAPATATMAITLISPTTIVLSGLPDTAPTQFEFTGANRIQTFDFTAAPASASAAFTFDATAAGEATNGVTAAVAATPGGAAGAYTLTVTAPTTDTGSGPYTDTVTVTATDTTGVRTQATATIAIVITAPLVLSGLPATATTPFTFGGTNQRQEFAFTVTPGSGDLTFTATSTGLLTALFEGGGGDRNLILNAPASDDDASSGYSGTLTVTATDTTGASSPGSHDMAFTITPTPITLSGFPADAEDTFSYGVAARNIDFTVSPAAVADTLTATVAPATSTLFRNISVTKVSSGNWRLSLQPPASAPASGPYSETLTITVTDPSGARADVTHDLTFTVPTPATDLVLTGLPSTATTPFTFGGTDQTQTFEFTVEPASTSVTFTATSPGQATASVAATPGGNAGEYTLTVEVPASDDDGFSGYSDTVTVTARDDDDVLADATHTMALTITPTPITLSVVTADATAAFDFGDDARDISFEVYPDAVIDSLTATVSDSTLFRNVSVTEDLDTSGTWILSLQPLATDPGSGPYTETLTITVSYDHSLAGDGDRPALNHPLTFTINPAVVAPITLTGLPTGLPPETPTPFTFSGTNRVQTFPFSVTPTTATFATPTTTNNTVTAAITARGTTAGDYTLTVTAPTTDNGLGPYTDTITVTASAPSTADVTHDLAITITPIPVSITLNSPDMSAFDHGDDRRTFTLTVTPDSARVTVSETNDSFTSTIFGNTSASRQLRVTPPATDDGTGANADAYSNTITVTASTTDGATGRNPITATQELTLTVNPVPIELSGVPGAQSVVYASGETTHIITVTPPHITLAASSANSVVGATIAPAVGGAAGEHTLTITPPTTGAIALTTPFTTDTVTITPTDSTTLRNETPETINYTITPRPAATFTDLTTASNTAAFEFGADARTIPFTVSPDTVSVIALPATSTLFSTWELSGSSGSYTLTIQPIGTDPGTSTSYRDTITVTAMEDGRMPVTESLEFTINPSDVEITGLAASAANNFDFGGGYQTLDFTVTPVGATFTFDTAFVNDLVTATVATRGSTAGDYTLTIAPVADDPGTGTYTDTVTLTASSTGRTADTQTVGVTLNVPVVPVVSIENVSNTGTATFDFAETASTITFDVTPDDATVTVVSANAANSANKAFTIVEVLTSGTNRSFTLAPPASDDGAGPYTDTVTITATSGTETVTRVLSYTLTPTPITLSGAPTGADTSLVYAADASTYTITVSPPTIQLAASSADSVVGATIEAAASGTAGEWTLTVTPPTTGTTLADTVTITATDPDSVIARTEVTEDIAFTITLRAAATFTDEATDGSTLATTANTAAFNFGAGVRTINFSVDPTDVPVTISPTSNTLFSTWSLTNNGSGSYTLTIQPLADDPGTTPPFFVGAIRLYSEALTVTAGEDGRTSATQDITFTINPSPIEIVGLLDTVTTPFTFSGADREQTFDFTVTPPNAAVTVTAAAANVAATGVTAAVAARGTNAGDYTLTVTAPDTDDGSGPYSDTIIVNASSTGRTAATPHRMAVTLTPAPIALSGVPTGAQTTLEYTSGETTHTITVTPPTINLAVSSTGSVVGATIIVDDRAAGTWTLTVTPRTTGTFTPNGTVTIIATDPATLRTKVEEPIAFTVTPRAAATFTDQVSTGNTLATAANTAAFAFGAGVRTINFSVSPDTVPVTIAPTSSTLFSTWNLADNGSGSYTLTIQPITTDPGTGGPYSETLTVTATEDGRTPATQDLTFTITPTPITLTGLPASVVTPFDFGGATRMLPFTIAPPNATFTFTFAVNPTNLFDAEVTGTGANRVLEITPVATDPDTGTYTERIVFTTSATGRADVNSVVTATVNEPIGIENVVATTATFAFNEAGTVTFDISPADATFEAVSANATNSANNAFTIAKVSDTGTARSFTVTAPATDDGSGPYDDTITITASSGGTTATHDLALTLTPAPLAVIGLPTAARTPFTFSGPGVANPVQIQTFDFTVTPANATVTFTAEAADDVVTAEVTTRGTNAGDYTLTVTAPDEDFDAFSYSDTVTVTVTDTADGRSEVSYEMTVTLTPEPITLANISAGATDAFEFGGLAREIDFDISPDAVVDFHDVAVSTATLFQDVTVTEDLDSSGTWTLSLRPPATDDGSGPYTETLTITVTFDDEDAGTDPRPALNHPFTFTINPADVELTDPDTSSLTAFDFAGSAQSLPFTVAPANATFTFDAVSTNSLVTATVTGTGANRMLVITPVATDPNSDPATGTYTDTVTLTASSTGRTSATVQVTVTLNQPVATPAVVLADAGTGTLISSRAASLEYASGTTDYMFTADPTTATITVASTNSVVGASIAASGTAGEWTLTLTAPTSGTTLTDTITITAEATSHTTTAVPITVTVTPRAAATFTGLDAAGITDVFEFNDGVRTIPFTVSPATATATISPASSTLFSTWNLANNGSGSYTLTIQPPAGDPGTATSYSETLTITASEDGRTPATEDLTFTINPASPPPPSAAPSIEIIAADNSHQFAIKVEGNFDPWVAHDGHTAAQLIDLSEITWKGSALPDTARIYYQLDAKTRFTRSLPTGGYYISTPRFKNLAIVCLNGLQNQEYLSIYYLLGLDHASNVFVDSCMTSPDSGAAAMLATGDTITVAAGAVTDMDTNSNEQTSTQVVANADHPELISATVSTEAATYLDPGGDGTVYTPDASTDWLLNDPDQPDTRQLNFSFSPLRTPAGEEFHVFRKDTSNHLAYNAELDGEGNPVYGNGECDALSENDISYSVSVNPELYSAADQESAYAGAFTKHTNGVITEYNFVKCSVSQEALYFIDFYLDVHHTVADIQTAVSSHTTHPFWYSVSDAADSDFVNLYDDVAGTATTGNPIDGGLSQNIQIIPQSEAATWHSPYNLSLSAKPGGIAAGETGIEWTVSFTDQDGDTPGSYDVNGDPGITINVQTESKQISILFEDDATINDLLTAALNSTSFNNNFQFAFGTFDYTFNEAGVLPVAVSAFNDPDTLRSLTDSGLSTDYETTITLQYNNIVNSFALLDLTQIDDYGTFFRRGEGLFDFPFRFSYQPGITARRVGNGFVLEENVADGVSADGTSRMELITGNHLDENMLCAYNEDVRQAALAKGPIPDSECRTFDWFINPTTEIILTFNTPDLTGLPEVGDELILPEGLVKNYRFDPAGTTGTNNPDGITTEDPDGLTVFGASQPGTITLTASPLTPTPLIISGLPTATEATVVYAAAAATYDITVFPTTATLAATSTDGVLTGVSIAAKVGGDDGVWTLTVTPPTTGTALADTVTITATDPSGERTEITRTIAFTITPRAAATFTGLDVASNTAAFEFGNDARTIDFTVSPATATATISPASSTLFSTWAIANNGSGSYTLTIQPLAGDPGTATSYSQVLTVTASEDGRTPATQELVFTVNPPSLPAAVLSGLPTGAQPEFALSGDARTFSFTVDPADAVVTAESGGDVFTVEVTGTGANRVLTVTPPSATSSYSSVVVITASAASRTDATHVVTFTITSSFDVAFQQSASRLITGDVSSYEPFLSDDDYPNTNLALNSDNATLSAERAAFDVPYIEFTFDARSEVDQTIVERDAYAIPRGWTLQNLAGRFDGSGRFVSWPCDTGYSVSVERLPYDSFSGAAAGTPSTIVAGGHILPYARELTETRDLDGSGSIDQPDETRKRCIAPEGLSDVADWIGPPRDGFNFDYAAYTPEDGWTITPESVATPVYITPTEPLVYTYEIFGYDGSGSTSDSSNYNVPVSPTFEAEFTFNADATRTATDLNGLEAISTNCAGARNSAADPSNSDFCAVTLTPPSVAIQNVVAARSAFAFNEAARTVTFDITPADATFEAVSANSVFTIAKVLDTGTARSFTVTPPTTDDGSGPYTDTITITATSGTATTTREVSFTLTPASLAITGLPTATEATVVYAAAAATYDITVFPTTATLVAASTDGVLTGVSIAAKVGRDDGVWTLTVTPPTTGTDLTDTVTITATDPSGERTEITRTIAFTITPRAAATFTGLDVASNTAAFEFNDGVRTIDFTVSPATVPVTIAPTTSTLFSTWSLTGTGGSYTLNIQPPADDPGTATSYSETLTITASEDGRTPATETLTFTINPEPVGLTGVPTGAALTLNYGASASTFTLTADPTDAVIVVNSPPGIVIAAVAPVLGTPGQHTLTITPPSTGTTYTDTVTITATDPDGIRTEFSQTLTFTVNPPPLPAAVLSGLPTGAQPEFALPGDPRGFNFTVDPADAVVTAESGGDLFTVEVTGTGANRVLTVTPPSSTSSYSSVVVITASAASRTDTTHSVTFTITPPSSFDIVFEQRTAALSIRGGARVPQPFLTTRTFPRSNLALNADNATVSSARASYDVGYIQATFQASTEVGQLVADETSYTIPRGWTVANFAAAVAGGRRFLSWECDADGHSETVKSQPTNSFLNAAAGRAISQEASFGFLPYARELIETKDIDGSGSIDQPDETRTRCIAPEGLSTVIEWGGPSFGTGGVFTHAAYTPTDDWVITQSSIDTPVYITPTESLVYTQAYFGLDSGGDRFDRADYNVAISDTFRAEFTFNADATRTATDLNGLEAISTNCAGARNSAADPSNSDFCAVTLIPPSVILLEDLPTGTQPAFDFGDDAREIDFSVRPDSATVTVSDSTVFDVTLTDYRNGQWELSVEPPASDPGNDTYTDTLTITASQPGRVDTTYEITFTINEPAVSINGVNADTAAFAFGGDPRTVTFDIAPDDATFEAVSANATNSANNALFISKVSDSGTARSFTVTPPASDDGSGPYTDTVTITATSGAETATHVLTYTLTPAPIALSGLPTGADTSLVYAADASTPTITVTPPTITLAASSTGVVGATIAVLNSAAGTWTLTITPPTTGTALTDTVTITATDPATQRTQVTETIAYTITLRDAATFTDLADADVSAFDFGADARTIEFTVSPDTVPVTISPTSSNLFSTWALAGSAGSYTLTIQPLAGDPGTATSYSQVLTVTASEDGRTSATETLTFTINPEPVGLTGVPTGAALTLDYGASASTFTLVADPTDARVTATSTGGIVTAAAAPVPGTPGSHTLTITPPNTGTTYTDTVKITATDPDGVRTEFTETLTFTVNPPAAAAITSVVADTSEFEFGDAARTVTFDVDPDTASFTAVSNNDVFTIVKTDDEGTSRAFTVTPPESDSSGSGPYTDTVTITASAGGLDATDTLTYTIAVPPVTFGGSLPLRDQPTFTQNQVRTFDFTVAPAAAEVTVEVFGDIFGASISGTGATRTLTVRAPFSQTRSSILTLRGSLAGFVDGVYSVTLTRTGGRQIFHEQAIRTVGGSSSAVPLLRTADNRFTNRYLSADGTVEARSSGANSGYDNAYVWASFDSLVLNSGGEIVFPLDVTVPRGFTVDILAADSSGASRSYNSWNCDPSSSGGTVTSRGSKARTFYNHNQRVQADVAILPFARELIETNDIDGSGSIDQPDETRIRCVAPEGLEANTRFNVGGASVSAYTPETGWTITRDSRTNPRYITPADGAAVTLARVESSSSDPFVAEIAYNSLPDPKADNGLLALSSVCRGARNSATDVLNSDFCVKEVAPSTTILLEGLPTGTQTPLDVGGAARSFPLTVLPATATVDVESIAGLFNVAITGTGSSRTLVVTPLGSNVGFYSDTVRVTASLAGSADFVHEVTFTITDPVVLTNLPTSADTTLDYAGSDGVYTISAVPTTAVLTAGSTGVVTASIEAAGTAGDWTLTVTPPSTGETYRDVVTINASADGYTTIAEEIEFTITPPPVAISGPTTGPVPFDYGDTQTVTFTVSPANAEVEQSTVNSAGSFPLGFLASINNNNGTVTLSIFGEASYNPLFDSTFTTTITANDPTGARATSTHEITFTIRDRAEFGPTTGSTRTLPASATSNSLLFGNPALNYDFTVTPADAVVTVATVNDLVTHSLTGPVNNGEYTLTVTPPVDDDGSWPRNARGNYLDTVTITATTSDSSTYGLGTYELNYTVTALEDITATGLEDVDPIEFIFGATAQDIVFTVVPATATVSNTDTTIFTTSVTETGGAGSGVYTLSVTPPASGTGVMEETITITIEDVDPTYRTYTQEIRLVIAAQASLALDAVSKANNIELELGTTRFYRFTVDPLDATVTAVSDNSGFTLAVTDTIGGKLLAVTAPTADPGGADRTASVTVTATHSDYISAEVVESFSINPPGGTNTSITITGSVIDSFPPSFPTQFGRSSQRIFFTVSSADIPAGGEAVSKNGLFTISGVSGGSTSRSLGVQPIASSPCTQPRRSGGFYSDIIVLTVGGEGYAAETIEFEHRIRNQTGSDAAGCS